MYLLIFQAWATMNGFTNTENLIAWNSETIQGMTTWAELANITTANLSQGAKDALLLTELMSHATMILIFIAIIAFIVGLFNAVSSWARR